MPRVIRDEQWDRYTLARRHGFSTREAAQLAGIGYSTALRFNNGDVTVSGVGRRIRAEQERKRREAFEREWATMNAEAS